MAVEQGTATFQCQHSLAVVIGWRVNGIPLSIAALHNVSTTVIGTPNGVTSLLSIGTLLVYNGITVECIATFIDGSSPQFAPPVRLLIQGITIIIMSIPTNHCCTIIYIFEQTPPNRLRMQPF